MSESASVATIPQLVKQAAESYGDQVFLEDGSTKISFKDFEVQCRQLASSLINKGIKKGDRIGVWAPNTIEWVIAAVGAQCAGAVLVTLNTRYKASEAAYILNASRAKMVFSVGFFLDTDYPAQLAAEELPHLENIVVFPSDKKTDRKS
ncbi:MAG: AMP-binding protein, partial [Pseudomonadales bacterium]|nr:AMP-binding protein [Pseudomonadales bacterium]